MLKSLAAEYGKEVACLAYFALSLIHGAGLVDDNAFKVVTDALVGLTGFTVMVSKTMSPAHKITK